MIIICDYGAGNVGSIRNIIKRVGGQVECSHDPDIIAKADKIILPGVGHFDHCMGKFKGAGLVEPIINAQKRGAIILGICVGMQMLLESSEEGQEQGLGFIAGFNQKFAFGADNMRPIPQMGWNRVVPANPNPLLPPTNADKRFYFVHSYHANVKNSDNIMAYSFYGYQFASAIMAGNVFGVQFHPEKSHQFGLDLFKRFIAL